MRHFECGYNSKSNGGPMKVGILVGTMVLAAAATAMGQAPAPRQPLASTVQLWLEGSSTVRAFKCTAKTINSNIVTDAVDATSASLADLVTAASVVIPVNDIDCANGTMNGHMRKALKAEQAAEISFKLTSYEVNGANATLNGTLSIAGQENPVQIRSGWGACESNEGDRYDAVGRQAAVVDDGHDEGQANSQHQLRRPGKEVIK
jgi:polyisoprenoid-binding protein YceI